MKKAALDSGDGGEQPGESASGWSWCWRLGLSAIAAYAWAYDLVFPPLDLLGALLLWGVAWSGFGRSSSRRATVALLVCPPMVLLVLGSAKGSLEAIQDYGAGVARSGPPRAAGPGRVLHVDPETRVPRRKIRGTCGFGRWPVFRTSIPSFGYDEALATLLTLLGPMPGSYRGPLPDAAQVLTWLRSTQGEPLDLYEADEFLSELKEPTGERRFRGFRGVLDEAGGSTITRTPARDGGLLVAWESSPPGRRPAPPAPGDPTLQVLLVDAATRRIVAVYSYVP